MKYKPEIIDKIIEEMKKVPNIRYVCSKVGIDHSTLYRWLLRHPTFKKNIIVAIHIGKSNISSIAEATIINGVNSGDYKSSTFWLTHNDVQYMQKEKAEHQYAIFKREERELKKQIKLDGKNFESVFFLIDEFESNYDKDLAKHMHEKIMRTFCDDDQEMIDACEAAYQHWKKEKAEGKVDKKLFKIESDDEEDLEEEEDEGEIPNMDTPQKPYRTERRRS